MEDLLLEIRNAANVVATPNCAAWISAVTSIFAVIVACIVAWKQYKIAQTQTEISKKQAEISEQQNKIALFDKKYEVYRLVREVLSMENYLSERMCEDDFYESLYRTFEQWQWPGKEQFFSDNYVPQAYTKILHKLSESKFLFPKDIYTQIDDLKSSFINLVLAIYLNNGHIKHTSERLLFLTSVRSFRTTGVLERMELDMQLQSIKLRE